MNKTYFITGGTGFVGKNIVEAILNKSSDAKIKLLVRSCSGVSAVKRAEKTFGNIYNNQDVYKRIEVIEGNVTEDYFGLSKSEYECLTKTTKFIFHSAASVKFNLPLDQAYAINVKGTENLLKFASECHKNKILERYNHISTAYVVGRQKQLVSDFCENNFANTYEATKNLAEKMIRQYCNAGLPATIFRPSIISGNSITGEIPTNCIVFIFILLLANERLPQIPCNSDTSLNIVPINYVIDLVLKISEMPEAIGNVYNITREENISLPEVIEFLCQTLNTRVPKFVPIHQSRTIPKKVLNSIETFIPYFEESHHFDLSETLKLLGCKSFEPDDFKTGFMRMIKFCWDNKLLANNHKKHIVINSPNLPLYLTPKENEIQQKLIKRTIS